MAKKVLQIPQHKTILYAPAQPDSGFSKIYPKSDGKWYSQDDTGTETPVFSIIGVGVGQQSTVRLENCNNAAASGSTVSGGYYNCVYGTCSTIGGGMTNTVHCNSATISGGKENTICGPRGFIGGGFCNTISSGYHNTISGGKSNSLSANYSAIGGGLNNCTTGLYSIIGGGYYNHIGGNYSTVSGGYCNTTSNRYTTISGGELNVASGKDGTISGGYANTASGKYSYIGAGRWNTASSLYSTSIGGKCNVASGTYSAILGGCGNTMSCSLSGAFGCNITAVANNTFHVNNLSLYDTPSTDETNTQFIVRDNTTGILKTRSYGGLFAQIAQSTPIAATTVETSLITTGVGTLSVPANGFKIGDSFMAKLCGEISAANNETIQFRIKSGAVVLADLGKFALSAVTNHVWELTINFTIRKIGAAGSATISTNGGFTYVKNSATAFEGTNFNVINSTTFDTTVLNTLSITAEWGSTNAANTIHSDQFVLTKTY